MDGVWPPTADHNYLLTVTPAKVKLKKPIAILRILDAVLRYTPRAEHLSIYRDATSIFVLEGNHRSSLLSND